MDVFTASRIINHLPASLFIRLSSCETRKNNMLYNILLIVQIIISISIITLVLLQHGKGADAGAAFGSGASGTVFGARGSGNFLSRTTAILAALFFSNCLALAWIVAHKPETTSLVDKMENVSAPAPATKTQAAKPAETNTTKSSVADQIPADTGDNAKTAPAPAADKTSEIPE